MQKDKYNFLQIIDFVHAISKLEVVRKRFPLPSLEPRHHDDKLITIIIKRVDYLLRFHYNSNHVLIITNSKIRSGSLLFVCVCV